MSQTSSTIKESLRELVGIVHKAGVHDFIKFAGSATETTFEALDHNKRVFLHGRFKKPIPEFDGIHGINSLPLLSTLLSLKQLNDAHSSFRVVLNSTVTPRLVLEFRAEDGYGCDFQMLYPALMSDVPKIHELSFDYGFLPTIKQIDHLISYTKAITSVGNGEAQFTVKEDQGKLVATVFGHPAMSSVLSNAISGHYVEPVSSYKLWPVAEFASLAKASLPYQPRFQVINKGAMQIDFESERVEIRFLITAHSK